MSAPQSVAFTIPGRIGGKGRPRFSSQGGKVRTFTPAKTQSDEGIVRQFAAIAMTGKPLFKGALRLDVEVYRRPPISWSAKRVAAAAYVTGKPDCDNVLKLIGDSLNGIVYHDDSQIAALGMVRMYQPAGPELFRVTITELEPV